MLEQLTLSIAPAGSASFESFYSKGNEHVVAGLRDFVTAWEAPPTALHLFGVTGCGKTHLLRAAMRIAVDANHSTTYVAFQRNNVSSIPVRHFEKPALICLDDIDVIAGIHDAERAVFRLYEKVVSANGKLLTSARSSATQAGFGLRDLANRLQSGASYRVVPLSDARKRDALQFRAACRGFELSDEVIEYVLRRYPRDTHTLFGLLECIDEASLSAKRRVTIPFLKDLEARLGL